MRANISEKPPMPDGPSGQSRSAAADLVNRREIRSLRLARKQARAERLAAGAEATEHLGSAPRINTIARMIGAERYLEIGVSKGVTFCSVAVPNKVAVDPHFKFDIKSRPSSEQLFEMESDKWFLRHDRSETFDVIFIDGLHTFDQTFRDFCNSLLVANRNTIWVIDDTVPTDIYSAWPDQREARQLRLSELSLKKMGERPGAWFGDVYKVVFAINDFFPRLSFRTIFPDRKAQTVVWQQVRTDFQPLFNSMGSIAGMSYFDFKTNFQILRPADEETVLREISEYLAAGR